MDWAGRDRKVKREFRCSVLYSKGTGDNEPRRDDRSRADLVVAMMRSRTTQPASVGGLRAGSHPGPADNHF
jgi:hypothetical protein